MHCNVECSLHPCNSIATAILTHLYVYSCTQDDEAGIWSHLVWHILGMPRMRMMMQLRACACPQLQACPALMALTHMLAARANGLA